jgi:hypothetical protein
LLYNGGMSRVIVSSRSDPGPELWAMALDQPQIDPTDLCGAIERELGRGQPDFRTRLLVRDAVSALARALGAQRVNAWIERSPHGAEIQAIARADLGPPGFPSLAERLMESTKAETVLQFLRELGQGVTRPAHLAIGGSTALILGANLSRRTEDIDVVDEVPVEIREQHALLDGLARRYGLRITHFQSHYLPCRADGRSVPGPWGVLAYWTSIWWIPTTSP